MLRSFFIHSSKFNTRHYEEFLVIFFEIFISIVHYDHSFFMVLDYDTWHNQKLPHGILIKNWKYIYKYLDRLVHSHT
jgi:hypothetical protein